MDSADTCLEVAEAPSDPDIACSGSIQAWSDELKHINRAANDENACLSISPDQIKTPQPRTPTRLLGFTALVDAPTLRTASYMSANCSRAVSPHSCLQRSRSTSSDSSTTSSSRSVRFTESEPKIKYTWPKEVYDRAPIIVDDDLRIKRCPTQCNQDENLEDCPMLVPKPRTWVVDSYSELTASSGQSDEDMEMCEEYSVSVGYDRDAEDDDDADTKTICGGKIVSPVVGFTVLPEINEEGEIGKRQSSHDVLLHLGFGSDDEDEEEDEESTHQHSLSSLFPSTASSDSEDLDNLHPSSSSAASCEDEDTPLPTPEASPAPPPDYASLLPKYTPRLQVTASTGSPRRLSNRSSCSSASSDAREPTFVRWDTSQQQHLKVQSYDSPVISPSVSSASSSDEEGDIQKPKKAPKHTLCGEKKKSVLESRMKRLQALQKANKEEYTCLGGF